MAISRRTFIRRSGGFLGGAMFASSLKQFNLVNVLAQKDMNGGPQKGPLVADPDYKALICIFMFGGNDPNNMIVPMGTNAVLPNTNYSDYSAGRAALAIPEASLLPITPSTAPHAGITFGLNPGLSGLMPIWSAGKLAAVCNVGTLYAPMNRTQYLNSSVPKPEFLFSHDDQANQWQTAIVRNTLSTSPTGWGGRLADNTSSLNPPGNFPMMISTGGVQLYTTGVTTRPLVAGSGLSGFTSPRTSDPRYIAMQDLLTMDRSATLIDFASDTMQRAIVNTDELNTAINDTQTVTRVFPSTGIGGQMRNVARTIARAAGCGTLPRLFGGLKRQIFFCSLGGFDSHTNQISTHNSLLPQLGAAMAALYNATVDLGIQSQVTSFTLSDFGRTLRPTDTGTDHAWGSHHFVMGGAVNGGTFYGLYPRLVTGAGTGNGSDDSGSEGRWIPTTAVDQYGATLATWFGLSGANMATVFPNIGQFATQNLGFLS